MKVLRTLLASRKFVATLLGLGAAVAARYGLDPDLGREVAQLVVGAVAVYVGATALEDAAAKRAGLDSEPHQRELRP